MKTHRPGFVLGNRGEELKIYIENPHAPNMGNILDSDIVVTVNELTSLGDIRLGIFTPRLFLTKVEIEKRLCKSNLNRLCLTRAVGTSVVIRKKDGVGDNTALHDLANGGIYIFNSTSSLQKAGHKTGASLVFHANESIWKVVRLELTLLRANRGSAVILEKFSKCRLTACYD